MLIQRGVAADGPALSPRYPHRDLYAMGSPSHPRDGRTQGHPVSSFVSRTDRLALTRRILGSLAFHASVALVLAAPWWLEMTGVFDLMDGSREAFDIDLQNLIYWFNNTYG